MNPSQSLLPDREISSQPRVRKATPEGVWPVCLWVVDDNKSVRDLIADLLDTHEDFLCPKRFSSAEEMLEALAQDSLPDIILMDLNMGGMTGVDAIPCIRRCASDTRVVIMTTFYDGVQAARAMRAGASSFILKGLPVEDIITSLKTAWKLPLPSSAVIDHSSTRNLSSKPASRAGRSWNAVRGLFGRKKCEANPATAP
jgi:DNA-binding NarL/FixJ family response regulator